MRRARKRLACWGGVLDAVKGGLTTEGKRITVIETAGSRSNAFERLTRQPLERHLEGLTEKLRSGDMGRVREAIRASVERIVVGEDGALSMEVKPGGLLGGASAHRAFLVPADRSTGYSCSPA
jgi:hypothetical protein